jgi:ATP-binding cassette subfamily B protein
MRAHDKGRLGVDVLVYLAINGLAWIMQTSLVRGLAGVGQDVVLGLRQDLFDHLTTLSLRYFSQQKAGWIISRLTSDVDALSDVLSQGLTTLVVNTLTLLAAIVGLFILDWRLGLVALVILPPTLVLTRWFQVKSHAAFLRVRETISSLTAQIAESVSGMAVIQAFNRERAFLAEFDKANDANRVTNTYAQYLNSLFFPAIELLGVIAMVSVLWVGGRMLGHGSLTIGTLVSSVFLLNLVFQPLQELSDLYGQVQSAGAAMEKITTVLDTEAEIHDEPSAIRAPRIEGDLALDRVTFSYGRDPVLHAIDIHVPAGGCLALVGEATTCAHSSCAPTAASSASSSRIRSCSPARSRTTSASHIPTRPTRKSRTSRMRSASTASHAASSRACSTRCARAARASRPASAS